MSTPPSPPESPSPFAQPTSNVRHDIPNHLAWAIVSTVFATIFSMLSCCCLPLGLAAGVPAIIFAMKVNKLASFDDHAGAHAASEKAKLWCWITTGVAILFGLILILSILANTMGWVEGGNDWNKVLEQLEKQR